MTRRRGLGSLVILLGAMLAMVGCGSDPAPGRPGNGAAGNGGGGTGNPAGGEGGGGDAGVGGGGGGTGGGGQAGSGPINIECGTEPDKDGECKPTAQGVYGIKAELDVWWGDEDSVFGELIQPGRGTLTIFLRGEIQDICENGTDGRGVIQACGSDIPPFLMPLLCEAYKIDVPDEAWDQPTMPTFETRGYTSGFNVGDILTLAKQTGLLGIRLDDPNGQWLSSSETDGISCPDPDNAGGRLQGADCFPDHDGDGLPGLTVRMRNSGQYRPDGCNPDLFNPQGRPWTYRAPPINFEIGALDPNAPVARADRVQAGVRVRIGGAGAIASDCMSGVGDADAEFFDSRAWGCKLLEGTHAFLEEPAGPDQECNAVQSQFLDDNLPVWKILQKDQTPPNLTGIDDRSASVGPRAALVRLGDPGQNVSCADVRNANYPAFN